MASSFYALNTGKSHTTLCFCIPPEVSLQIVCDDLLRQRRQRQLQRQRNGRHSTVRPQTCHVTLSRMQRLFVPSHSSHVPCFRYQHWTQQPRYDAAEHTFRRKQARPPPPPCGLCCCVRSILLLGRCCSVLKNWSASLNSSLPPTAPLPRHKTLLLSLNCIHNRIPTRQAHTQALASPRRTAAQPTSLPR
jgi:hypothetical protein